MRIGAGERYVAWDEERRAREAKNAAFEEAEDLRALLELERRHTSEDER